MAEKKLNIATYPFITIFYLWTTLTLKTLELKRIVPYPDVNLIGSYRQDTVEGIGVQIGK